MKLLLDIITQRSFPPMWAETQVNLGSAYWERIFGWIYKNLELAIQCYQSALSVFSIDDKFSQSWAWTQLNLGTVYYDRVYADPEENLELAFECYHAASKVCTRELTPDNSSFA